MQKREIKFRAWYNEQMNKNGETTKSELRIIDFGEYSFRASSKSGETRNRLTEYFFFESSAISMKIPNCYDTTLNVPSAETPKSTASAG